LQERLKKKEKRKSQGEWSFLYRKFPLEQKPPNILEINVGGLKNPQTHHTILHIEK